MLRIYIKPKVERITQYEKNAQNIKFMNRKVANYYVKIINELYTHTCKTRLPIKLFLHSRV